MTHRTETIMTAVKTAVDGLTTTEARVERSRIRGVEVAPALSIEQGGNDVNLERSTFPRKSRDLNIKIIAHVKTNTDPETQLNLISEEVYIALRSDPTLGLSYVTDIESIGDDEPEFTGEAEKETGRMQMNFIVKYWHSWDDPGA